MRATLSIACAVSLACSSLGCREVEELDDERGVAVTDSDSDSAGDPGPTIPLERVALLLVMDNSISMTEEHALLTAAAPALMSTFELRGVGDVRVAVTSSDMGLSWGGEPYEEGDGWPGTNPCSAAGWDGAFNECPGMAEAWAQTSPSDPDPEMPEEIACLADVGAEGCGFEQQLRSMERGLTRDDQSGFVREGDLLVVLVISDEDDCSMADGPGLFASDEVQGTGDGPSTLNVACGNHPEFLYTAAHFAEGLRAVKGGAENGVLFAAIVGVPPGGACEGTGAQIAGCLDSAGMQLDEVVETNSAGQPAVYFAPACTRFEGSVEVTHAIPARRIVELASEEMPTWSYVASICDADWTPHIMTVAGMAADAIDTY